METVCPCAECPSLTPNESQRCLCPAKRMQSESLLGDDKQMRNDRSKARWKTQRKRPRSKFIES